MIRTRAWGALFALVALVLAFVPLFDLLGYEVSFVFALLASFAGAHLGASTVYDLRRERSRSEALDADAHPLRALVRLWLGATVTIWSLLLLPLVILSLNALRVRNCSFASGLLWFALLPGLSATMGAATGVTAGVCVRRRLAASLLAVGFVLASLLWSVYRFYAAPPIFAYDPFAGYFPGTLYDEEVAIGAPLLWSRFYQLSWLVAIGLIVATFLDGGRLRLSTARLRPRLSLVALLLLAHALLFTHARPRHGFFYTADDIAHALGAEKRTAHFVLHYDPNGPFAKDIDLFAEDHELRWAQLKEELGVEPVAPVHSFLFDTAERKHELMGAQHTFIAKPWRREIYLQYDGWPHPVLMHELAHVFAGRFGDAIFGVSRRGVGVNVGLIEGVAVAAAWQANPLTPDQTVKTLADAHLLPPLNRVMSLGFLGLNAAQAYNVAGSFCHFLLERHGAQKLEEVYRQGGSTASWQAAYGRPLAALEADWKQFLDGVSVPPRQAALAKERLERPSVFHKVCAHELALLREQAQSKRQKGDKAGALALLEHVCAEDPDDPENVAALMDASDAAGDEARARADAQRLLAHQKVSAPLKARAWAFLGDLALRRHDRDAARAAYDHALALPLDDATSRLTTAKRLAADEPPGPIADDLIAFLAPPPGTRDTALDLLTLRDLVGEDPSRPLFHYLFARQLEARGRFRQAGDELDRALAGALPNELFTVEALRLLGRARYRAGQRELARAAFERLARRDELSARLDGADWLERIRFDEGQR